MSAVPLPRAIGLKLAVSPPAQAQYEISLIAA